jgi:hypothetical protein
MGAGFGQYGHNNLHVYADSWTVRDYYHTDHYCQSECNTDIHGCGANLFWGNLDRITNHI